jgi:LEA14-like dessication related protein
VRWFVAVAVVLTGCQQLDKMPDLKQLLPKVRFGDVKVDDLNFQKLDGKLVLEVDNPYPVGLGLRKTDWKLGLAGHPFLDGTDSGGLNIEPAGTGNVRIPFSMKFVDALNVASDAGGDRLPYTLDTVLGFDTPLGPIDVPLHHEGTLPALRMPKVRLTGLRIQKFAPLKNEASLAVDVSLHSDQPSALNFESFDWGLKLAGNDVASGNTVIGEVTGDKEVTLPIDLNLLGIGEVIVEALTRKSELKVRLTGDAKVGTPFGVIPLAIDEVADLTPRQ